MAISPEVKQIIYSFGALLNLLSFGMALGYTAILIPALQDPTSDLLTDEHQASWLVSISGFSILIPVLVLGPLMHVFGRRTTNFCVTIPIMIGWIMMYLSYSLPVLLVARFLHMLGAGSVYFVATCIAEFSSPSIRGMLLNMKMLTITVGVTIMHLLGSLMPWRHLALVGTVPSVLALVITLYWPETPDWLVSKGKFVEAENVFLALRGKNEEFEIKKLIEDVKIKLEYSKQYTMTNFGKQLHSKAMWRPVILLGFGILLPEFGGRLYFPVYSIELAKQISGDATKGFIFTYVIDAVTIISTILSCFLVKKYKRRHLLLYPSYFSVMILVAVAVILLIRTKYYESVAMMWVTLALLSLYFFVTTCTAFAISFVIMGELLPLEYRAVGSVLSGVLSAIIFIVTMKLTPVMKDALKLYGMFFVYSVFILLSLLYFQYDLPETKDRTLQDIADYFKGKSPKLGPKKCIVNLEERNMILSKRIDV